MARAGVQRLVLASSMVVYGEGAYSGPRGAARPAPRTIDDLEAGRFDPRDAAGERLSPELIDEDAALDPRNVYATTKLAQEHLAAAWARSTGGTAAALRYHNVYGPGMPQNTPYAGVASLFRSAVERGEAPRVFEDGRQRRDFVHVRDVASANVAAIGWTAAAAAGTFRAFNVGSGDIHTIGELAEHVSRHAGGRAPIVTGEYRLGDVRHITASSRAAARRARLAAVGLLRRGDARVRDRSAARGGAMSESPEVDVVLPCLNEAAALPWVLSRLPEGYRAIVVDNGSTDGSAGIARDLGAVVVTESRRGFGSAAHAGLLAADAPVVAFCDADASMDPADLPLVTTAVRDGDADLVLGRRRPTAAGAWPLHARIANRSLALLIRRTTGLQLHDLGPMRAARRQALLDLDLRDRRSGYPLEMLLRANSAGWRIREVDAPYSPRVGRSKVTGTVRGTITAIGDMSRLLRGGALVTTLIVIAKEPLPGRAKTRLHPPLSLEQAALVAAAAIDDTLRAMASVSADRRILLFDGRIAPRGSDDYEVIPQVGGGLDERLAAGFDACDGPTLLIGMDTPQVTATHLRPAFDDWALGGGSDAWFGPASDGGFWALGLREPRGDLIRGVPMSTDSTGDEQFRRLIDAGLSVGMLPVLDDVDTIEDARAVAALAPSTRFAAVLSEFDVAQVR